MFGEREKFLNKKKLGKKGEIISFIIDIIFIVFIVLIIKTFLVVPFVINGQSMYHSYYDKEFIIVDKISYILGNPIRGDVIVFRPGISEDKKYFLKRIIGMPGDSLKIEDGKVYVKSKNSKDFIELQEAYLSDKNNGKTYIGTDNSKKVYKLGEGEYFVMGDNRLHSTDSRECFSNCIKRTEFITKKDMVGKVLIDLGYFDGIGYDSLNKKINIGKFQFLHPELGIKTTPKLFSSQSRFNYKELEN